MHAEGYSAPSPVAKRGHCGERCCVRGAVNVQNLTKKLYLNGEIM
ncbi:hypothetical protein ESA_02632 [Cronobacter sakazakii ATCC BAA-894]|uniref:Uncharacterized protein n=1 Tax=Cronobacter sakazakii (strain ATCC BAA-894) TaxID=290339 RepID=A7MQX0_CROS8|nr:hypothetical protein ESA_02632 [Cronobacter sakazakii ATCC BAA-894]